MKRTWPVAALASAVLAALALGVGAASGGWAGITDLHYDNSGRTCTDGIEFGLAFYSGATISVTISDDTDPANPIVIVPQTPLAPLHFAPVPELFGLGSYLHSSSYRVLFPSSVAPGRHLDVHFSGGSGTNASTGELVENCQLGTPFSGFFGSVRNPPAVNAAAADKQIKLKFSLPGDHGLSIFTEGPTYAPIPCGPLDPVPSYQPSTTVGTLRYDAHEDRYTYRWDPPSGLNGCYTVWFRATPDGLFRSALFNFG
jgi:hypothetical protein